MVQAVFLSGLWTRENSGTDVFFFKDLHNLIIHSPKEFFKEIQHKHGFIQLRFERTERESPGPSSTQVWQGQQLNVDVGAGCLIQLYLDEEATSYDWKQMEYDEKAFYEFSFHFKYKSKRGFTQNKL